MGIGIIDIIILVEFFISIYNSLIALKKNEERTWYDIDILLQKRHDALMKLLETTSSYLTYERTVLERLTQMRTQYMNLPSK
jgi:LemA protein